MTKPKFPKCEEYGVHIFDFKEEAKEKGYTRFRCISLPEVIEQALTQAENRGLEEKGTIKQIHTAWFQAGRKEGFEQGKLVGKKEVWKKFFLLMGEEGSKDKLIEEFVDWLKSQLKEEAKK